MDQGQFSDPDFISFTHQRENLSNLSIIFFSNVTNENICGNISNIKILHMLIDELLIKRFVMINKFIFCVHLYSDFYSVIISRQKYVLNAFKSLF